MAKLLLVCLILLTIPLSACDVGVSPLTGEIVDKHGDKRPRVVLVKQSSGWTQILRVTEEVFDDDDVSIGQTCTFFADARTVYNRVSCEP